MEELKGLLRFALPLVLLAGLALFQIYFRKSFGGGTGTAPPAPSAAPTPGRVRPEPAPTGEDSQRPQRLEIPRGEERSTSQALGGSAADGDFPARRARTHLRRLLADPAKRPIVILAREILHRPAGCWWDERER